MEINCEQDDVMIVKTEVSLWAREYGVFSESDLSGAEKGPERVTNLSLKDELKLKILERRKREGKSDIELKETGEPKNFQLTAEELALRDRRRMSNRLAARKCRNKKKFRLKENKKAICELVRDKDNLTTKISEIEKEIADIKYLWRLVSIPGTAIISSRSDTKRGVTIMLDSAKQNKEEKTNANSEEEMSLQNDEIMSRVNRGETPTMKYLQHCGLTLIAPAALLGQKKKTEFALHSYAKDSAACDSERGNMPSFLSFGKNFGIMSSSLSSADPGHKVTEWPLVKSETDYADSVVSASQSSCSSQDSELGGAYVEMKAGEMSVSSAYNSASSDCDSDIEVIELEERKLVIDLTV